MKIFVDLLPGHDEPLGSASRVDPLAFVPVGSPEAIEQAARDGHGLWLRGLECGGPTSPFTALVLLRAAAATGRPFVVSGLGIRGMAAALALGAEGVVLDVQTWIAAGSPLCAAHRKRLRGAEGRDTTVLWTEPHPLRLLTRGTRSRTPPPADWWLHPDASIPAPQSVGDLARLGEAPSLANIVEQTRDALEQRLRAARSHHPLRSDPFGCGTPIVQGPMANVAEGTGLACAVARAGALPFFALGALSAERGREVLDTAARDLGHRAWGTGIIGFDVALRREAHLDVCAEHPGRPIIVAGGAPALARRLRERGLRPWLHAPAPRLVGAVLDEGAEAVILEGHEAGGHVGELTSAGLWEEGLAAVEQRAASEPLVVLAGGIGCPTSAAFAGAMAAVAHARGARVALQVGTAFFFTHEAVESGQITPIYQRQALAATETVLVGTTVHLPLRCAPNAFTEEACALERRMLAEDLPLADRRERLQRHDIGRTRIAARGIERAPGATEADPPSRRYRTVPETRQRAEGAFTMGQGAVVTRDLYSVAELVDALTVGAAALLEDITPRHRARPISRVDGAPPQVARAAPVVARSHSAAEPIAIVGLGCALPGALDVATFWQNLVDAVDAVDVVPPERWRADRYVDATGRSPSRSVTHLAGVVPPFSFDPARFRIPPAALPTLDRSQQLALFAAAQAVGSAHFERGLDRRRAAVVLGNSMGGEHAKSLAVRVRHREVLAFVDEDPALAHMSEDEREAFRARAEAALDERLPPLGPDSMAGLLSNVIAGRVAAWLDWMGGNLTVDAACAASLAALTVAVDWLRARRCDAVLTGGVDTDLTPESFVGFSRTQALSRDGASPFSERADGFVMGEGAVVLALQRLDDALASGRPVWAVIRGIGQASDGRARGITAPRAEGQRLAIERAHAEAGFGPEEVGLIEAHGTGTPLGDATEVEVLRALHHRNPAAWLGSVKSNLGHLKAAAGAAGTLKATLALATGIVPPTLHAGPLRADLRHSALRLPRAPARFREGTRRAAVSAFGFGGTDFHLLLEQAPTEARRPADLEAMQQTALPLVRDLAWSDASAPLVLCFGAPDRSALLDAVRHGRTLSPEEAAASPWRAVLIAPDGDRRAALERALPALEHDHPTRWVRLGQGPAEPVVLLAPGQGSQRVGAVASLARIPRAARALASLAPLPTLEAAERDDPVALHLLLPCLAAAWAAVLRDAGVPIAATAGHSLGEIGALIAAGRLDAHDALELSRIRGEALASCPEGAMLAVELSPEEAGALAREAGLSLASLNSPRRCTLSGPVDAIEAASARLTEDGIPYRRLAVRRAYHSPTVAPAEHALRAALQDRHLQEGASCWSAHTLRPFDTLEPLARAVTAPVRFHELCTVLHEAGHRLFVEIGPGRALTGAVERTLPGVRCIPLDPDPTDATGVVVAAASLLAAGHPGLLRALPATMVRIAAPAPPVHTPRPTQAARPLPAAGPNGLEDRARALMDLRLAALADPSLQPRYEQARRSLLADLAEADAALAEGRVAIEREVEPLPTPPAPPDPLPAPAPADEVRAVVVETICEVTGYPSELLDDDADLTADLGVDSIRKMEILGLLQDRLGFRAEESDYTRLAEASLGALVAWAEERRGGSTAPAPEPRLWIRLLVDAAAESAPFAVAPGSDPREVIETMMARAREPAAPLALTLPDDAAGAAAAAFARCLSREWDVPATIRLARGAPPHRLRDAVWLPYDPEETPLPERPVILATGGGHGIVVSCLRALADLEPRVLLLGRSDPDEDTDRSRQLRARLDALRAAGVEVVWQVCDVRNPDHVERAAEQARSLWGRIDVVLHGAGALRDGPAATRTSEDLEAVLGPKLTGAHHLVAATTPDRPQLFVTLSSVVAHHGNPGQTLYAAANAALEHLVHPTAGRTLVFASTAWSEVGMASDPGLQMLLRARGVHSVTPEQGARLFRRALLGHARSGPPTTVLLAHEPPDASAPRWPLGCVLQFDRSALKARIPLDPTDPPLRDHRVADRPLVPAALWLTALEQAARLLATGSGALAVEDFQVVHPTFVDEPRTDVTVEVRDTDTGRVGWIRAGTEVVAEARIGPCDAPASRSAPLPLEGARRADPLYRPDALFHGPSWRVLRRLATDGNGRAWADLEPGSDALASAIDGAHQLLAAWSGLESGRLGLPVGARRWVIVAPPTGPVRLEARARLDEHGVEADVVATDADGRVVLRGEGVALRSAGARAPWSWG